MSRIQFDRKEEGGRGVVTVILRKGIFCIPVETIRYLQKERRLLWVVHEGGSVGHYGRLEEVEDRLPGGFFRCHNSTIVNLAYVERMEGPFFHMRTGEKVRISQRKQAAARRAFLRFLERG